MKSFMTSARHYWHLPLLAFLCGLVLSCGISALAAEPGSQSDPLVTKAWLESYLDAELAPLEAQLDDIASRLGLGKSIILTVGSRQAAVDGQVKTLDSAPQIMGAGYTMVPVRFIGEALGLTVDWDEARRMVTFSGSGRTMTLIIDNQTANINGQAFAMDYPAIISDNRTLVHVRFISEAFQCRVEWHEDTRQVHINR